MYRIYCKTCGEFQFCSSTKVNKFECPDCFFYREERTKKAMEQRLQELKEKITSFVRDYNIKDFNVEINEDIDLVSKDTYETQTKVNLEIRV